jgi:cell wall-associated NlpC family hydrolase
VLAAGFTLIPAAPGQAAPNLTLNQVKARVAQLQNEAEIANEQANTADLKVQQTRQHLAQVQRQLSQEKVRLDRLSTQMGAYAAAMYANGGIDPSVQLMLSDNPGDFLAEAASLDQVARMQDSTFRQARTAALQMTQTQREVDQQLAQVQALQKEADANRAQVNAKLAETKALLSKLTAAEQRRLAAQQAARTTTVSHTSYTSNTGGSGYHAPSGSGRGGIAVAYAMAQVGKAYVYGGTGPYGYDCSGLTMMAWAQAGVSLPHSASAQYAMTPRVAISDLQPGDLMFFYSDIHHVGMYIGGGMFVNAENPSVGIRVQPLAGYWSTVYVGAGRV